MGGALERRLDQGEGVAYDGCRVWSTRRCGYSTVKGVDSGSGFRSGTGDLDVDISTRANCCVEK